MKFMISVDCEGSACVVGEPGRSLSNSRNMEFARAQATRETNAAVRALYDAGAQQVVVWDSHSVGVNLVFDQLDPRCELLLGFGFGRRFPKLDKTYTGVLMIGYHAMEGTPNAVLAHTYSSDVYRSIHANGQAVGEIALDASVAGELSVPLIFVTTDEKGCEEALSFMPWIETVVTKKGYGRNCAHSKHPAVVEEEIYQSVKRAIERKDEMQPFTFEHPTEIVIEFKRVYHALKAKVRRNELSFIYPKSLKMTYLTMLDWKC